MIASAAPRPEALAVEPTRCPCGNDGFDLMYAGCPDRLHWLPGRFDIVRCARCGLVQTSPRPTPEVMSAYYPPTYVSFRPERDDHACGHRALARLVRLPYSLRFREPALPRPQRPGCEQALDVGCGAGVLLAQLSALGWEPWGIEPSPPAAKTAVQRLGVPHDRIQVARAEDADLPDAAFGLMTMAHVLEHVHDPLEVLGRARRWLEPGGRLRLWVPNVASLESRVFGRYWFGLDPPRHLYHFAPPSLRRLLEHAGFAVERMRPQYQGSSLAGSLVLALDELLKRQREYRLKRRVYYPALAVSSLLAACGSGGALEVWAGRR